MTWKNSLEEILHLYEQEISSSQRYSAGKMAVIMLGEILLPDGAHPYVCQSHCQANSWTHLS